MSPGFFRTFGAAHARGDQGKALRCLAFADSYAAPITNWQQARSRPRTSFIFNRITALVRFRLHRKCGRTRYRSLAIRTSVHLLAPAGAHHVSPGIAEGGRRRERADDTAGPPAGGGGGLRRAARPADRAGRALAGADRERGRALAGGAARRAGQQRPAPLGGRDRRGAAAGARPPGRGRGAGEGRGRAAAADAGAAGRRTRPVVRLTTTARGAGAAGHGSGAVAGVYLPPVSTTWPVTARRIRVWTTSSLAWLPAGASTMAGLGRGTPSASSPRTAGATRATTALIASEPASS